MHLRYDPFQVFKYSRTPAGLYARQKWLGESTNRVWRADFQKTVKDLLAGQSSDGSWGQSIIKTVQHLFGLHLTIREQTEPVTKALGWLFIKLENNFPRTRIKLAANTDTQNLKGLPFTKGCSGLFLYGATLFLCSVFGLAKKGNIKKIYERLNSLGVQNGGRWCGWSCSNNIIRAFVVHPRYAKSKAMVLATKSLGGIQRSKGDWMHRVPFYQTVNAFAHLDFPQSDSQLERAFKRAYEIQNSDGTWGRNDREWNTFLVVHALRNKAEI